MFRVTMIAALAGFVSANSFSIGCMNTLMNIANTYEISQCLAPNLLLPILVGAGNTQDSIIPSVDAWLGAMCAAPPCSTNAMSAFSQNITAGCSAEFDLPDFKTTVDMVTKNYWTARKVVCLKDGQTNCATQTLKNLESISGTLNLNDNNVAALAGAFNAGLPSNVTCTNCAKGAFSIINADLPGAFSDTDKKAASDKCGASFVDGGIPQGLVESAYEPSGSSSAAPSPTSTTPASSATSATARPSASVPVSGKNAAPRGASASLIGVSVSGLIALITGLALV